jgi:hypothetical protein
VPCALFGWNSPSDEEAEITKLKDGRTALAYKAENAVDMETGAIVAVTTHSGAAADTTTVKETVMEAGMAVAGLIAEKTPAGAYAVHPEGIKEVVTDKGYHSNDVMIGLAQNGSTILCCRTGSWAAQLVWQPGGEASGA